MKAFVFTTIDKKAAESAVWRSPSGESKLEVMWHMKSDAMYFDGGKAGDLVKQINGVLSKSENVVEANNSDLDIEESVVRGSICTNENEISSYSGVATADMEGIKLDMSILEARLVKPIYKKSKSDISLLQMKLKELEGVIRHQDDVICKLSEDNFILKSKLSVKLTPKVIHCDHVNNEQGNESTSVIHVYDQFNNLRNTNKLSRVLLKFHLTRISHY